MGIHNFSANLKKTPNLTQILCIVMHGDRGEHLTAMPAGIKSGDRGERLTAMPGNKIRKISPIE
jgi:hypothetical protein